MKRITITVLKNINKYFIDKYYDELCNDIYGDSFIFNGEFVDISNDTLKWVCEFVENKQDYDKLSKYGDFYYKIKLILNNN